MKMTNEEAIRAQFSSARKCSKYASEQIMATVAEIEGVVTDANIRTQIAIDDFRGKYLKDAYYREHEYSKKLSDLELGFNMRLMQLIQDYYNEISELIQDYNLVSDTKSTELHEGLVKLIDEMKP